MISGLLLHILHIAVQKYNCELPFVSAFAVSWKKLKPEVLHIRMPLSSVLCFRERVRRRGMGRDDKVHGNAA